VRRPVSDDQRIDVHTYDYLLDRLEGTLSFRGPSGLNPRLIQPWRDGDIVHAGTELGEVSSDVETAEPELDIRKPFTTGKPKGK
jgi:hypothetical protein